MRNFSCEAIVVSVLPDQTHRVAFKALDLASKPLPSARNILVMLHDLYARAGSTNAIPG